MRYTAVAITFALSLLLGTSASSDGGVSAAKGVVVAVQGSKNDARINDPNSMGDMVEIWMVRIDKWTRPEKPGFILVQYNHRDSVVKNSELDSETWKFELIQPTRDKTGTCMSWWTAAFIPTAMGDRTKLPEPKSLPCFLMKERPLPVSLSKAYE